ncbi:glycosyltransferase family 2 protein, partial [Campylobacter ureolyticus]
VPVYNVEKYLKKCIQSIINQTYKNLEIILVDDGSSDNSGKICDEFAQKDNRIKVIHKTNGGLSDARNAGLDGMSGEWVSFVDSDDFISPYYVENL